MSDIHDSLDKKIEILLKRFEEKGLQFDLLLHDIKNELLSLNITLELLKRANECGIENFPLLITQAELSYKKLAQIVNGFLTSDYQKRINLENLN